jgi:hypothetical protein
MKIRTLLERCLLVCTSTLLFSSAVIAADDPPPSATALETQKLKDEIELMKAEKELLELKVGTLPDGITPKGDVTPTTLSIEGEILAYSTVDKVAQGIVDELCGPSPGSKCPMAAVAIFSEAELKLMAELRAVNAQVKRLEDKKSEASAPAAPAGVCPKGPVIAADAAGPLAVAGLAVQAFSLFRVDRALTGTVVKLDDFAVTAQVANKLQAKGARVIYLPSIYDLRANETFTDIGVYKRLAGLRDVLANDIKGTEGDRKKLEKCPKSFPEWFESSAAFLEQRKQLLAVVNSILDEITKPDDAGVARIQAFQRASRMMELSKDAWLLQIKPIAAAGNVITTKNILFTKLRFGGGSVISYMLFNASGELQKSGTLGAYEGGKRMSDVPLLVPKR